MPLDPGIVSKELVKFGEGLPAPLPDYIQCLESQYLQLTINGLDDKEGYDQVHKARMDMRDLRVKIEKKRKELKEDSIAYGRAIDGEAKRINAMIEPIETYLSEQEKAIDDEKERIRKAKEEERMAAYRKQIEEENAKKIAEENARLEEARKAQEEDRQRLKEERDAFEAERKAQTEELRQKEIKIEAEKIAHQWSEELNKSIDHKYFENEYLNKPDLTAPQTDRHPVARISDLEEIEAAKLAMINKFFEPYDVNYCDHVEAPSKEKHVLYGQRYIVKDKYIDKDIVEYILDEMSDIVYGIAVNVFGMGGK